MLFFNFLYQFFLARRPTSRRYQTDPEKGPEPKNDPGEDAPQISVEDALPTGTTLVDDRQTQVDFDAPQHLDIDDERDADEITRELEREEYPDTQRPRPRRPFERTTSMSSVSSVITSTVSSGFRRCWANVKDFLSISTSLEELESYVPKYRLLPIVAGVIIPFAILLEVPGLTEDWYIRTQNNQTIETRKNPPLLEIGLAFSLFCAVAANICLIFRFLEKEIKLMTILCIAFLTIHGKQTSMQILISAHCFLLF